MDFEFRKIQSQDINSVWTLIELLKEEHAIITFSELCCKDEVSQFIDNPAQLTYVAVSKADPNKVLCMVRGRRELAPEKAHAAFLTAATHPDARGTGLAAKLTSYALEQMKAEGVSIARIYVYSDNLSSLGAVRKLGFVHSGTVLRHHQDPKTGAYVDDLIFHKILV